MSKPIAYTPSHFACMDRERLLAFVRERTFATLVAVLNGEPLIAHAPVVAAEGALRFHLAKGNPFLDAARAGLSATALFQGPDAYVSPDWYVSENQVPTWNYITVYARGLMRPLAREEMIAQVDALSAEQEDKLAPKKPWTRAKMTKGSHERMFAAIEGVEMRLDAIEGKFKLSQNKTAADIAGAASALEALGASVGVAIAAAMRQTKAKE